jgi:predicted nucleic acid-binding protein
VSDPVRAATRCRFLDTSVIVRYFMEDVPEKIERVRRVVEQEPELAIAPVTLAETLYVLTRTYKVPREVVVDHLVALVQRRNIQVHGIDKGTVIQALLLCRPSGRVSFTDALMWAVARSAGTGSVVYTLDEGFPSLGIDVLAP